MMHIVGSWTQIGVFTSYLCNTRFESVRLLGSGLKFSLSWLLNSFIFVSSRTKTFNFHYSSNNENNILHTRMYVII